MITSMTSQEAQERLIEKVIAALAAQQNPRPRRTRLSPSDHYSIAKYARANNNITSWLIERREVGDLCDLAIEVSCF
jgi:plasmid replication initiation protein